MIARGAQLLVSPADFRREFPVLERVVHLASCSLGARSTALDGAIAGMLDTMGAGTRRAPWHRFEDEVDGARRRFADLIGARPDQIAIVPNASVGAYQAVSTLDLRRRPRLLTTNEEFPSVAHIWLAQRPRGAEVVYVGDDPERVDAGDYRAALDERVAMVSVPMATYRYGVRLPVEEVVTAAHAAGARVFVDAYQAAGVLPIDVDELGCDFLVAGTTKYLLGLPGLAFLYARGAPAGDPDPTLTGWFGRVDPFAFDVRQLDFPATARRFETGTPAVPAVYAANAGLGLIGGLDLHAVRQHVGSLVELAAEQLAYRGEKLRIARDPAARGAHFGLVDADPSRLGAWLAERDIAVSPRGGVARIAFHYYNNADDVAALCAALDSYRGAQRPSSATSRPPRGAAEVVTWLSDPAPAHFPYDAVVDSYLEVGKHFVPDALLEVLALARDRLGTLPDRGSAASSELARFLGVALDKYDDRYDYTTYIGLGVLPLPGVDDVPEGAQSALRRRDRLVVQLLADALGFELAVADGSTGILPELRPDGRTVEKRYRHGMRVAVPALARLGLHAGVTAAAPAEAAWQLRATVDADMRTAERRALALSMLPVYVAHDEYLFVRVLQLFETTFAMLAGQLNAAVTAMTASDWRTAVERLEVSELALRESAPLFSLLATMQIESFRTFREFTVGASAIQSRTYKIVESLCRTPDPDRLDSMAYRSVPEVRDRILAGQPTLDDAYRSAVAADATASEGREEVASAMRAFSDTMLRWRHTHSRLVVRMLGERTGTGNTEGTPYLNAVRTVPVFRSVTSGEGASDERG